jgi:NADH-quinone oxidoreductase subunit G
MPKITINREQYEVPDGLTIIQACDMNGIEIPRFCYHDRLSIAGNCRMCLVEVSPGPPKPQASCALPVAEGMVITTDSDKVKKDRQGVMEFLLINHPLDCPICDQGGECDLQDQAMAYGSGLSRFMENKRAVEEKNFGPLIKTFMTRCIHCTRCVRFAAEIAGVEELGATGRGEDMEIGTYIEKALSSELSGNMIDICPVGALTSKPYAFHSRPWELKKTESIDVLDAVGSNIRIDSRGNAVLRILPRLNEDINEEWISDKTRFACDGLKVQRLDTPMIRLDGNLVPASWEEALEVVSRKLATSRPEAVAAIAGDMADCESMMALKDVMDGIGATSYDCRQDGAFADSANRAGYIFNSGIAGIEQADAILLIGCNPRMEAAMVNARIRKRFLMGGLNIALIGERVDLTYPYQHVGNSAVDVGKLMEGKGEVFERLKSASKPMIIIGASALAGDGGEALYNAAMQLAEKTGAVKENWNGFNVLQSVASRVGGLDIGFVPQKGGMATAQILSQAAGNKLEVLYLLGADEIDTSKLGNTFVIYQGHHGDAGAHRADVILPGAAYTEKSATYVSTEGRVQRTEAAVNPPGEAKEDWKIIRALSTFVAELLPKANPLPYDDVESLRTRIIKSAPHFANVGEITVAEWKKSSVKSTWVKELSQAPFVSIVDNFYMTDPISRASKTMAECTEAFGEPSKERKAA